VRILYLGILVLILSCSNDKRKSSVVHDIPKIGWLTLEEAENKLKVESKDVFVMVHADWCPKCDRFKKETYINPKVIKAINDNFYPVMINAHEPRDILYKNKMYSNPNFDKSKGLSQMNSYHEVLFELGAKSVPAIVFLDSKLEQVGSEMGFKEADELRSLINLYKS